MKYWVLTTIYLCAPIILLAQGNTAAEYTPLIGVPGLSGENLTTETYIEILYILTISVAAFLAVARLVWAGVQYMLTDVVTDKEKAKKDIQNSLIGLLIVIGAVLILNTINPNLTRLGVLNNMEPVTVKINVVREKEALPYETNDTGLDSFDLSQLTDEQIRARIEDCQNPSDGTPGKWVVRGDNTGDCIGNETQSAQDNTINTPAVVETYISENNLSENEALNLRRRYNQFVATQEPENISESMIEQIKEDVGADEVLFVVKPVQTGSAVALEGYYDTQVAICTELTKGQNIVEDRSAGYVACVR